MAIILIVDDSWLTRRALIGMLSPEGYQFHEAQNGKEAIEMLKENRYECLILDLLMPEMNGFDVLKEMKKLNVEIPVIVLTADIQDTTKERCLALGAFGFANKPPVEDILRLSVKKAVNNFKET